MGTGFVNALKVERAIVSGLWADMSGIEGAGTSSIGDSESWGFEGSESMTQSDA